MAQNKRSLAGFGEVANENNNDDSNINVNINNNDIDNNNVIDKVLESSKKKNDTVLTGVYLKKDIAVVLDRLGKKGGRGAKSKIVNEVLRAAFKEKGLL